MESKTQKKPRSEGTRTALWLLLGFIVGFGLPVLACMGLFIAFVVGLSAIGAQSGAGVNFPTHISGPMSGPAVGVIEVSGTIVSGSAPPFNTGGLAAAEDIKRVIKLTAQDTDVKAILVKVNSPGGSVVASDLIYQELKNTHKPIVVLMGDLAASGGYYISMAADHIIANPNTLAGSIGVISTFPNAEALFEKVGLEFSVFTSGDSKDFGSLFREMTPQERAYWQEVIDETHGGFVSIVTEGRGMTEAEIRALADGRVYTGRQALELGLVDELAYEEDAIKKAANLGIISGDPRVIRYTSNVGIFSALEGIANILKGPLPTEIVEWMLVPRLEFRWVP